nr:hypothetical protein [Tanacetum cinerariifolium]
MIPEKPTTLLLETKYRRLPVVDVDGRLVGLITRGDVVRAALKIKHAMKKMHKTEQTSEQPYIMSVGELDSGYREGDNNEQLLLNNDVLHTLLEVHMKHNASRLTEAHSATSFDSLIRVFRYKTFDAKVDWGMVAKASPFYLTE